MSRRVAFLASAALAAGLGAACLSKPALTSRSYAIDPPPPAARPEGAGGRVLEVAPVQIAPSYAGRSLCYRTGEHRVERDPYARFSAPPGAMLQFAILGYLANADFVSDVVETGSDLPAVARVEVTVTELYGDLPEGGEAAAVLALQFRVVAREGDPRPAELLRRSYARRVPVPRRAAAAFVDGWTEGLSAIMAAFSGDLKDALAAARPAS